MHRLILLLLLSALGFTACNTPKPMNPTQMAGQEWTLVRCENAEGQSVDLGPDPTTLNFDKAQKLGGYSGCNSYGGEYTLEGSVVTANVMSTKKYCRDAAAQENLLYEMLRKGATLSREGDRLILSHEGVARMIFSSAPTARPVEAATPVEKISPEAKRYSGLFIYFADAAVFTDCANQQRYGVLVGEGAFLACEKAYARMDKKSGEPVFLVVDAVLEKNTGEEGHPYLMRIERLVSGNEKGNCP